MNIFSRGALVGLLCVTAGPGCILIPSGTYRNGRPNPRFMVGGEGSDRPIVEGRTPLDDAVAAIVRAGGGPSMTGPAVWRPADGAERRVLVTFAEPMHAWGVTLNQHFMFIPMPMFGVIIEGEARGGVELEYDAAHVVTKHRRYSGEGVDGYVYVKDEEYPALFGEEGAAKILGPAPRP